MAIDFSNIIRIFKSYGVLDFLLPFFLIFTVLYVALSKVEIFKENKFRVIIAIILALLVVAPHITGDYPTGLDPIDVINETLPSIALAIVGVIFLLILLGTFGLGKVESVAIRSVVLLSIGFVIYVFGSSLEWWSSPSGIFSWWTDELSELLVILLVFGIITWFITSEKTADSESPMKKIFEWLTNTPPKTK